MKEIKEASVRISNVVLKSDEAKREAEREFGVRYDVSKTVSKKELAEWKKKLEEEEEETTPNLVEMVVEEEVQSPVDLPKDE